jgi:hypothetical protein
LTESFPPLNYQKVEQLLRQKFLLCARRILPSTLSAFIARQREEKEQAHQASHWAIRQGNPLPRAGQVFGGICLQEKKKGKKE